jgi:hypothetical protein
LNKRHVAAFDGTDPSDPRLVLPFCINMHESQISPSIESFECFARLLVYTLWASQKAGRYLTCPQWQTAGAVGPVSIALFYNFLNTLLPLTTEFTDSIVLPKPVTNVHTRSIGPYRPVRVLRPSAHLQEQRLRDPYGVKLCWSVQK